MKNTSASLATKQCMQTAIISLHHSMHPVQSCTPTPNNSHAQARSTSRAPPQRQPSPPPSMLGALAGNAQEEASLK